MAGNKCSLSARLLDVSKYIAGISAIAGVMWAGFKFVDSVNTQTKAIEKIETQLEVMQDSIRCINTHVHGMMLQMEGINENTVLIGNYVQAVDKGVREHLRTMENATLEHYTRITNIIDEAMKIDPTAMYVPKIVVKPIE